MPVVVFRNQEFHPSNRHLSSKDEGKRVPVSQRRAEAWR